MPIASGPVSATTPSTPAGQGNAGGMPAVMSPPVQSSPGQIAVTFVTMACSDGCADVVAVAMGGNPPYTFRWEDETVGPSRRVCGTELSKYSVRVTDTPIEAQEFGRDAQTVDAPLAIQCPVDRSTPPTPPPPARPPGELCVDNPSFEGTAQLTEFGGLNAPPWMVCDLPGSPDIRNAEIGWPGPGEDPTDGATYVEMFYASPVWRETLGGTLCEPMIAGKTYSIQLDLSYQGFLAGISPGRVELWASQTVCGEEQLLWTSPVVPASWQTFCATFTPGQAHTHLKFKPAELGAGVFIDHIVPVAACP